MSQMEYGILWQNALSLTRILSLIFMFNAKINVYFRELLKLTKLLELRFIDFIPSFVNFRRLYCTFFSIPKIQYCKLPE